ncbi:hypothetical protein AB4Z10_04030 [Bosea sp. RAF48]|uniref:hypothetical protein n=1 Tax=Bosea sp. RAF48 TaxID=3237480 RepID=UPI003F90DECD
MSAEPDNVPLNDETLEDVNGGYSVVDGLARLGHSVESSFLKGRDVGDNVAGTAGSYAGAALGAVVGTFTGIKNEIGNEVNEAIVALKDVVR